MRDVWAIAPTPALQVWEADGRIRWQANPAALTWAPAQGWTPADWSALAAAVAGDGATGLFQGELARLGVGWVAAEVPAGWLAWLQGPDSGGAPAQVLSLRREVQRLAERLDMAQQGGRLGVWERDVATGAGYWDQHIFRIFGLDPTQPTPSFDEAVARHMHPEDRERVKQCYEASLHRPGRHGVHYRVVKPDGQVSVIHSLWEVRRGPDGAPQRVVGVMVDDTLTMQLAREHAASRVHLDLAAELAGIAVWRHDLATGLVHFNRAGFEMTGVDEQPQGLPLEEARARVHPDDLRDVLRAAAQVLSQGGPVDLETRHRNRQGEYRTLLTRRVAERNERGEVVAVLGVSIDITEQVRERERAQTLADRMSMITDATGIGVWTMAHDTQMVTWNAQMYRIYGLDPSTPLPPAEEIVARWTHPQDRASLARDLARVLGGGHLVDEIEFRIVRDDGVVRWLVGRACAVPSAVAPHSFGVVIDVTESRQARSELAEARARAALAVQAAGMGTWERDCETGLSVWDAQMYRLRGLSPDDGRTPEQVLEAMYGTWRIPSVEDRVARLVQAPEASAYENEFAVQWPDGSTHWLASRGMLVRDELGRPVRLVGVNWDITDIKRSEQALRDKAAAEEAIRAKNQFLARVSHELRTPLNAVLGFSELMVGDARAPLPPVQRERAAQVLGAGQHLLALIDDLLELTGVQTEAGTMDTPVDLAPVVAQAAAWVAPLAEQAGVQMQVEAMQARALGDPRRLRQVFVNLISNAVKYNRRGGRVAVRALVPAQPDRVGVAVQDTGRGLSARQLARLFEPFNRLGAEREGIEGTGIGLSIVRHVLDHMGGTIEVDSTQGEGSEFRVWLRAAPPGAPASAGLAPAASVPAVPATPGTRVLYIEDNPVNVLLVRELLALRPGIQLDVAADGASGIRMALELRPMLVLVDLQLPDIGGEQVVQRLRGEPDLAHTRFVALSANAMPEDVAAARAKGFTAYWTKPVELRGFLQGLDELLAGVPPR